MTEQTATAIAPIRSEGFFATMRAAGTFFRRNLTPRTGVTLAIWRVETLLITPLSLVLIETLGRWQGAFAMSWLMAAFSLLFLLLLAGEPIMTDFRRWLGERSWGHWTMRIAERHGSTGAAQRALAVPAIVMLLGPFWRAVTMETFLVRKPLGILIASGGAFPHTMFWTGLVVGSVWILVTRPALLWIWDAALSPAADAVWRVAAVILP